MEKRVTIRVVCCVFALVLASATAGLGRETVIPYYSSSSKPIISDDAPHYLLWHEGDLWHLRWQSPKKKAKFRGELKVVEGSITLVERVNLEKKDKTEEKESKAILFKGKVKEQPEGFDFRWSGTRLWVDLYIKGEHRPLRVYIGRRAIRPQSIPFFLLGVASKTAKGDILSAVALGIPEVIQEEPHFFLWHEGDLWHLRWQSPEKKSRFSGELKAIGGSIELDRRVNLEKKDKTKVHPPNTITFKGKVKEQPEGFDFRWTGSKLMVDLKIEGEHRPARVYVGRSAVVPSEIPFYIVPGSYVLPFPPRHRRVHGPPPRELPPPFRHIPPPRR